MIGYITVGTNDMARARKFYGSLFGDLGAKVFMDMENYVAWSVAPDKPGFCIAKPFDGKPATVGNGVMIALAVDSKAKVDTLYKKAMELGATDEGAPGPRGEGFYAGYFRDPDGNKLNFFCMG